MNGSALPSKPSTTCAGRQAIGEATTTTPLLEQPPSGPIYALSESGGLSRLAFVLKGQVDLIPAPTPRPTRRDADTPPFLSFRTPRSATSPGHLRRQEGLLVNTRSLCSRIPITQIAYTGQNGKTRSGAIKVKVACGRARRSDTDDIRADLPGAHARLTGRIS
jgi:hypothetical protein